MRDMLTRYMQSYEKAKSKHGEELNRKREQHRDPHSEREEGVL